MSDIGSIETLLAGGQQAGGQAQFNVLLQLLTKMLAALPGSQASGAWSPTDVSGAGIPITVNQGLSLQFGNVIILSANITYGTTASGSTAKLSIPVKCGAATAIGIGSSSIGGGGIVLPSPQAGESYLEFLNTANAALTNADMSTFTAGFTAVYIAGS